ncbi:hypothetical protein [Streptomyces sp. NPDC058751]|uniref:hypothetical protein n=1 Tax=Streptomyces sp. NPDC058751 TaxID=3346623 RepID=UPI00367D9ADE
MTDGPQLSELLGATSMEDVLAEDFVYVLLKFSELMGYAEDGNWRMVHEKVGSLRQSLKTFDHKISTTVTAENGETFETYKDPGVDAKRTVQLITAYAQLYGGRLGPSLFPITDLQDPDAVAHIQARQEATRRFHAELLGDDDAGR